jgi:hypothetical protein
MMKALAVEHGRDPESLMRFLSAVFKRWRNINQPHSAWRVERLRHAHNHRSNRQKVTALLEPGTIAILLVFSENTEHQRRSASRKH